MADLHLVSGGEPQRLAALEAGDASSPPDPLVELVDEILDRMEATDRKLTEWIERLRDAG